MARIVSGSIQETEDPGFAFLAGQQTGRAFGLAKNEDARRQMALMMEFQQAMQESAAEEQKRQQQTVDRDALSLGHQMRSRAIAGKFGPIMQKREGRARVYQGALSRAQAKGVSAEGLEQLAQLITETEQAARFEEGEHYKRQTLERLKQSNGLTPEQVAQLSATASPADVLKLDVDIEERGRAEGIMANRAGMELQSARMALESLQPKPGQVMNQRQAAAAAQLQAMLDQFEQQPELWTDQAHVNRYVQEFNTLLDEVRGQGSGQGAGTDPSLVRQREVNTELRLLEAEFGDPKYAFTWTDDERRRYQERLAQIGAFAQGSDVVSSETGQAVRMTGQGGIPNLAEGAVQPQGKFTPLGRTLAEIGPILQRAQQGVAAGFQAGLDPSEIAQSLVEELNLDPNDPRVQDMIRTALRQYGSSGKSKPARKR